jgi:serpin B
MRRILACGLALAALLAAGCGAGEPSREPDVVGADVPRAPAEPLGDASLTAGLNRFGFDFHRLLAASSPEQNIVFSPLSIGMAFGMADAGARGETAAQIEDVFHLPGSGKELHAAFNALDQALADAGKSTLRLANRMYPATGYPLVPDFVKTLGASYGAPLERLDFAADTEAARERINGWVAERTERRIPELLPAGFVDPATVLVLVNALYLEAKWSQPFVESATENAPFAPPDGSSVDVPLMHNAQLAARYVDARGYQAVELPYGDGELSMLVVVPEEGRFADFERRFDPERLAGLEARLRRGIVDLSLPRWSASTSVDLLETLPKLGLELPFDQARADFTGISPNNPFVGAGVHAADIEVDEWGTVAAAATAIGFRESAAPTPDAVIRADRPFLYLIRHAETGAVLFLGRVVDPS